MIAISGLKRELILSHFEKIPPPIYVKLGNSFRCISSNKYKKEGNIVVLFTDKLTSSYNKSKVYVYFYYKNVKICFKSILEENNFFEIPVIIYIKKKKKHTHKFPTLSLYSHNLLISTFLSANLKQTNRFAKCKHKESIETIFKRSHNLGHNLTYLLTEIKRSIPENEELYSHLFIINDFLLKKERGKLKQKALYIFCDSNIILLFSNIKFACRLASNSNKNQNFIAKIFFKNRNISCNVRYNFFSPFVKDGKECKEGFLGFKITDIQEEDKRYLYEDIFTKQYKGIQ